MGLQDNSDSPATKRSHPKDLRTKDNFNTAAQRDTEILFPSVVNLLS